VNLGIDTKVLNDVADGGWIYPILFSECDGRGKLNLFVFAADLGDLLIV